MREPTCFGLTGEFITCTSLKNRQTDRPISLPVGTSSCSRCSVETSYSSSTYNPIRHIRCMATRCGSREKACASHYTSLRRSDTTSGTRRRQDSLMPCAFRGGSLPGGSYKHSVLSLYA